MGDRHSELRRVRDSKEVYLYDALPSATTKYTQRLGNRPLLVQAYVDNTHGEWRVVWTARGLRVPGQ